MVLDIRHCNRHLIIEGHVKSFSDTRLTFHVSLLMRVSLQDYHPSTQPQPLVERILSQTAGAGRAGTRAADPGDPHQA